MYKFSLIIPAYNISSFSERFFASLKSFGEEAEIIFVNDFSKDDTQKIIEKFIRGKGNMKLINHKENKGLGGALNTGVDAMTTSWYFHIDPDDVIKSNFYEEILKALKENSNAILLRYKFMFRTDDKTFKPSIVERNYFKIAFGWSCGINISKFGKPRFKEHFKMEDMDMFGRQYKKTKFEEKFINEYLVEYTIDRDESIMNNIDKKTLKNWEIAFENLCSNPDFNGIKAFLYKKVVKRKIKKQNKKINKK